MAASSRLPLAVLFVLVASAVPATTTAGGEYSGARMVIIRGSGSKRAVVGAAAGDQSNNNWRQHYRRLVEDEVAPEFGGVLLAAGQGGIANGVLDKDRTGCKSTSQCAVKGSGGSYTRPCTFESKCSNTPAGAAD